MKMSEIIKNNIKGFYDEIAKMNRSSIILLILLWVFLAWMPVLFVPAAILYYVLVKDDDNERGFEFFHKHVMRHKPKKVVKIKIEKSKTSSPYAGWKKKTHKERLISGISEIIAAFICLIFFPVFVYVIYEYIKENTTPFHTHES